MQFSFTMISLGKSTLIYSLNPIFCILFAFLLLGENLECLTIVSAVGAFTGMYFLSLNQIEGNDKYPILGISFAAATAVSQGINQINIRVMSVSNMSWTLRPTLIGISEIFISI